MKVLGANVFLTSKWLQAVDEILAERGLKPRPSHNQYRIICRCRGLKHGNEMCMEQLGLYGTFRPDCTSATGNATELALCEEADIWVNITGTGCPNDKNCYVAAEELNAYMKKQDKEYEK